MENKRDEILRIAKHLFYDNGYTKTSFSMIANEITSSRSAIAFFFENKFNLANEVYTKISKMRKNMIGGELYKISNYDLFVSTAVESRVMLNACRVDEKVRRFICELNECSVGANLHERIRTYALSEANALSIDLNEENEKKLRLSSVTVRGSHIILLVHYFQKDLSQYVDFDTFCDYYIRVTHYMYRFDEKFSDEIIQKSKELYERLNITYYPYFEFECQPE